MKSISRHRVLGLSAALLFFLGQASFAKTWVVYVGSGGDNFSPKTITIEPGDKIEWSWDSSFHSTTSGTPGNPSGMWDSGLHQTCYKYTYEFNNARSFPYYCSSHGGCCTMTGTVNAPRLTAGSGPAPSTSVCHRPPHPHPHRLPRHRHRHRHRHRRRRHRPPRLLRRARVRLRLPALPPARAPRRLRSLLASPRARSGWNYKRSPAA